MDKLGILRTCDHTLLRVDATWEEMKTLCDEGLRYRVASVCLPPAFVEDAAGYLSGRLPVCTVIGFPSGYATTLSKAFEAEDAVRRGADEIDMVIRIGWAKEGRFKEIEREIRTVKDACQGKLLKVIIEACLLTEEEKIALCGVVSDTGAEYIKTSTGFSTGGATREDVALLAKHVAPGVKVKAAGGIRTWQDAEDFLALGASRLGTSALVRLAKAEDLA